MSREIKFRVYSKRLKVYKYYYTIGFSMSGELQYMSDKHGAGPVFAGDYIVEQYTGLKDKNGKEIYEGDIMCFDAIVYEIYWSNEFSGWHNRRVDGGERFYGSNSFEEVTRFGRVIGNIHENSELLNAA